MQLRALDKLSVQTTVHHQSKKVILNQATKKLAIFRPRQMEPNEAFPSKVDANCLNSFVGDECIAVHSEVKFQ
ncbi:hypothetical protein M514_00277 [Trichuris suis]|uniref:Uncharacterized protein n=1 Tax=Trichuris suis TaxID=68888 RepID=A0A085NEI0_9BILA|nr:hypothetical protein M513_00277 [Trichuris suis]KFD67876.1 hypothetical protein M514_00277 [Trichuris suis]